MLEEDQNISDHKLVLIHDSGSLTFPTYSELIEKAAPHLEIRKPDWRKQLVVWDVQFDYSEIRAFVRKYGQNTNDFSWPTLVSVPDTSRTEVEIWTADWLKDLERRKVEPCYPVSGGWWSVDGDWNPSIEKVRNHLYKSPNHTEAKFELYWLSLLKFEEIQSLHSDHHREMVGEGKVAWKKVTEGCVVPVFSPMKLS